MGGDVAADLRELGDAVRRERRACGLSGPAVARLANVSQPTVSRIETGRAVADAEVVTRVVDALGLGGDAAADLAALVERAYGVARRRVDAGVSMRREGGADLVSSAVDIRCFQSAAVPRLLQTEEYARAFHALAGAGGDGGTNPLADTSRRFTFVVTEGAIRTWPDSPGLMVKQLDRIADLDRKRNVRIGIVPWSAAVPSVPLHGFTLHDDQAVTVETFTRELTLTDPADVAAHREIFDAFESAAVFGKPMHAVLAAVTEDFRQLEKSHPSR
ncbi:MAG TPA: helix-turn-helix transcriptional regulator [Streptosporangiaceae bacterium]|jgi:transcriptional regulator with XRE-family HTH domain